MDQDYQDCLYQRLYKPNRCDFRIVGFAALWGRVQQSEDTSFYVYLPGAFGSIQTLNNRRRELSLKIGRREITVQTGDDGDIWLRSTEAGLSFLVDLPSEQDLGREVGWILNGLRGGETAAAFVASTFREVEIVSSPGGRVHLVKKADLLGLCIAAPRCRDPETFARLAPFDTVPPMSPSAPNQRAYLQAEIDRYIRR